MIEDGTAIGLGLATAVNRLRESDAKSRVIILLTDGSNTAGSIPQSLLQRLQESLMCGCIPLELEQTEKLPFL